MMDCTERLSNFLDLIEMLDFLACIRAVLDEGIMSKWWKGLGGLGLARS